jgi:azobenzene reductase
MTILLLCGSIANKSHTLALLQHLEQLFVSKGHQATLWDLKTQSLPIALPEYHHDPTQHPDATVREFAAAVTGADAVILGSPLYHGSYSGVLKNALDSLTGDAFGGKWAGLVGNAGSPRASHVQLVHLRQVVNTMSGYTLQTQIGTSGADYTETPEQYELTDEGIKKRCVRLVEELEECIHG